MRRSFRPPSIGELAEVDVAECEYNDSCVEIQGVVSPSSQGGWPRTEDYSVHCFSFSAWRRIQGALINRELTILRPVAEKDDWFSAFPAYTLHRIKVLLSRDETRTIFASETRWDAKDPELRTVAEMLQRPVVIPTARFGPLSLDRNLGWFEGDVEWNGGRVRINFHPDTDDDISSGLKTAELLWSAQSDWKLKVEEFTVQKLLPVKNDFWLGDDEEALTADQFLARMRLESISFRNDGGFEFWHDDGDLFWGHSIQISGSLEEGLTSADIPG